MYKIEVRGQSPQEKFRYFEDQNGPRHTTNPSTLRKICVQKIAYKKLLSFSEKIYWHFETTLHRFPKHLRRHYPLKIGPHFDLKELENFLFQKICIFLVIFRYL